LNNISGVKVFLIMSLFGALTSFLQAQTKDLVLDLGNFTCGHSRLGMVPNPRDFFAASLAKRDVAKIKSWGFEVGLDDSNGKIGPRDNLLAIKSEGFEIGTKDRLLDYYFITIKSFKGAYSYKGKRLMLDATTTPEKVQQLIGTPYWIDRSDGEIIMFYEFNRGTIELQFEFPDQKSLGYITLTRNGVLSDPKERQDCYRVTAPWPPKES
jgi:hypothetical protein